MSFQASVRRLSISGWSSNSGVPGAKTGAPSPDECWKAAIGRPAAVAASMGGSAHRRRSAAVRSHTTVAGSCGLKSNAGADVIVASQMCLCSVHGDIELTYVQVVT